MVARLGAHHAGRLEDGLIRLGSYPLLVVDQVGYIRLEPEAATRSSARQGHRIVWRDQMIHRPCSFRSLTSQPWELENKCNVLPSVTDIASFGEPAEAQQWQP
jgi:hypothetical protein